MASIRKMVEDIRNLVALRQQKKERLSCNCSTVHIERKLSPIICPHKSEAQECQEKIERLIAVVLDEFRKFKTPEEMKCLLKKLENQPSESKSCQLGPVLSIDKLKAEVEALQHQCQRELDEDEENGEQCITKEQQQRLELEKRKQELLQLVAKPCDSDSNEEELPCFNEVRITLSPIIVFL